MLFFPNNFSLSLTTKYDRLHLFYHGLNDFRNFVPRTEKNEIKEVCV